MKVQNSTAVFRIDSCCSVVLKVNITISGRNTTIYPSGARSTARLKVANRPLGLITVRLRF